MEEEEEGEGRLAHGRCDGSSLETPAPFSPPLSDKPTRPAGSSPGASAEGDDSAFLVLSRPAAGARQARRLVSASHGVTVGSVPARGPVLGWEDAAALFLHPHSPVN